MTSTPDRDNQVESPLAGRGVAEELASDLLEPVADISIFVSHGVQAESWPELACSSASRDRQ